MEIAVTAAEADLLCVKEPRFAPLIKRFGLIRRPGYDSLSEALLNIVLSQQVSTASYLTQLSKVPLSLRADPQAMLHFLSQPDCPLRLSAVKRTCLVSLYTALISGRLNEKRLAALPRAELEQELTAWRGLGPWSVQMLEIFYLARREVFADKDYGVRLGLTRLLQLAVKEPPHRLLRDFAQQVYPAGLAASFYLWELNAAKA